MALADSCAKPNNRVRRQARLVTPGSAPAIAFALLPSVVGAEHATDGIALTATVTALCVMAAVLIQPLARRLDAHANSNRAATMGLLVLAAGLALGAATAHDRHAWLLVPCAIVLGSAYGLCLVAGLVEIQRLADHRALAGVTAAYHALAYLARVSDDHGHA